MEEQKIRNAFERYKREVLRVQSQSPDPEKKDCKDCIDGEDMKNCDLCQFPGTKFQPRVQPEGRAEMKIKEFVIQWGQEGMYDKTLDKAVRKLLEEYRREGVPTDEEIEADMNK